jgi:hypothetical protein
VAKIPASWECDLCKEAIDPEVPFPTLEYPFSPEELAEMVTDLTNGELPAGHSIFGLVPLPARHQFHFCRRCVLNFLPMVEDMMALARSLQQEEWRRRRRKMEAMQRAGTEGDQDEPRGPSLSQEDVE